MYERIIKYDLHKCNLNFRGKIDEEEINETDNLINNIKIYTNKQKTKFVSVSFISIRQVNDKILLCITHNEANDTYDNEYFMYNVARIVTKCSRFSPTVDDLVFIDNQYNNPTTTWLCSDGFELNGETPQKILDTTPGLEDLINSLKDKQQSS